MFFISLSAQILLCPCIFDYVKYIKVLNSLYVKYMYKKGQLKLAHSLLCKIETESLLAHFRDASMLMFQNKKKKHCSKRAQFCVGAIALKRSTAIKR